MARNRSVFNKRTNDRITTARTSGGGGVGFLPQAHAQLASNPTPNQQPQVRTQSSSPWDRASQFAQNIGRGGSETVRSYTTDMYDAVTGEYKERDLKDETLADVVGRGVMGELGLSEDKLDGAWEELGRRATDEPGRVVGEVAAETGIMLGTMGFGAAWKGGRIGLQGVKHLRNASKAEGAVGYARSTGIFRKGSELKFIGDKRTTIISTNRKGKVKTRNKRTNILDRIERKSISGGQRLARGLGRRNKFTPISAPMIVGSIGRGSSLGGSGFDEIGGTIGARLQASVNAKLNKTAITQSVDETKLDIKRPPFNIKDKEPRSPIPNQTQLQSDIYPRHLNEVDMNKQEWNNYGGSPEVTDLVQGYGIWSQRPGQTIAGATSGVVGRRVINSSEIPQPPTTEEGISTITKYFELPPDEKGNIIKHYPRTMKELEAFEKIKPEGTKSKYIFQNEDNLQTILKTKWAAEVKASSLPQSNVSDMIGAGGEGYRGDILNPIGAGGEAVRVDGKSYTQILTTGAQPSAQSITQKDTIDLINLSIVHSDTTGLSLKEADANARAIFVSIKQQQLAQQVKTHMVEEKMIKKNRGSGEVVMRRVFNDKGKDITDRPESEQIGMKIMEIRTPSTRMPILGTDPVVLGVSKDNQNVSSVARPIGYGTDVFEEIAGTKDIADTKEYGGVIKIISGGQTGIDQSAIRYWSGRGGEVGGTMPYGYTTDGKGKSQLLYTLDKTTRLESNQIFVYGANKDYNNYGGAAGTARQYFGAGGGRSGPKGRSGIVGQSYGVITKIAPDRNPASYYSNSNEGRAIVKSEVQKLVKTIKANPDKEFVLTKFGTEMAGFKTSEILGMFGDDIVQPNAVLSKKWVEALSPTLRKKYFNNRETLDGKGFATKYGLDEDVENKGLSKSKQYVARMEQNVQNSDGTVIYYSGKAGAGTKGTIRYARSIGRPVIINPSAKQLKKWTKENKIEVLNAAGTRGGHIKDDKLILKMNKSLSGITPNKNQQTGFPVLGGIPRGGTKGRLKFNEKLYIKGGTSARNAGAGKNIPLKNIVPSKAVYSYGLARNEKGKRAMRNKPYLDPSGIESITDLFTIRQSFWYAKQAVENMNWQAQKFDVKQGKMVQTAMDEAPMNPYYVSRGTVHDSSLVDIESFRRSLGLPTEDTVALPRFNQTFNTVPNSFRVQDILSKASTNFGDGIMPEGVGNWRTWTMDNPQYEVLLRKQIGEEVIKKERQKPAYLKTKKTIEDAGLDAEMVITEDGKRGTIDDVLWNKFYNEQVKPTIKKKTTPTNIRLGIAWLGNESTSNIPIEFKSVPAKDAYELQGQTMATTANITTSMKSNEFNPLQLWKGFNDQNILSLEQLKSIEDPYSLKDKVKRVNDEISKEIPMDGKGIESFDFVDANIGTSTVNPIFNMNVFKKITNWKDPIKRANVIKKRKKAIQAEKKRIQQPPKTIITGWGGPNPLVFSDENLTKKTRNLTKKGREQLLRAAIQRNKDLLKAKKLKKSLNPWLQPYEIGKRTTPFMSEEVRQKRILAGKKVPKREESDTYMGEIFPDSGDFSIDGYQGGGYS